MTEIVNTTVEHLYSLELKDVYNGEGDVLGRTHLLLNNNMCIANTILCDGNVIAIVGLSPEWKGVATIWMLTSELTYRYKKSFVKSVKQICSKWKDEYKIHRYQVNIKHGYEEGCSWIEYLGFRIEGLQRAFGPDGSDYWLYARVFI